MRALAIALAVLAAACTEAPVNDPANVSPPEATADDPGPSAPSATTQTTIPAVFHGRWDASAEACATGSEMQLTITGDELLFHESSARPTSVASRGPDAIRIEADFSGEGEEWEGTLDLSLATDRLTVTQPGGVAERVRCS